MSQRLPGGERRKASQRHSRPAAPLQPRISRLWHPGDRVRWGDRSLDELAGQFIRLEFEFVHADLFAFAAGAAGREAGESGAADPTGNTMGGTT